MRESRVSGVPSKGQAALSDVWSGILLTGRSGEMRVRAGSEISRRTAALSPMTGGPCGMTFHVTAASAHSARLGWEEYLGSGACMAANPVTASRSSREGAAERVVPLLEPDTRLSRCGCSRTPDGRSAERVARLEIGLVATGTPIVWRTLRRVLSWHLATNLVATLAIGTGTRAPAVAKFLTLDVRIASPTLLCSDCRPGGFATTS